MKVTVSLVTYNHERFIAKALNSILMQETNFPYEIIVGEDDSQDRTREIVQEYKRRYPDKIRLFLNSRDNVIFINNKPTGRWNFINNLKHAEGEYIAVLDGDDYWTSPHKLQKQVDFLNSHPECSVCFHDVEMVDNKEQLMQVLSPKKKKEIYTLNDLLKGNFIPACSVMFRRGLFGSYPEWIYTFPIADWPLHILNAHYGEIGHICEVMGVYRNHGEGIWNSIEEIDQIRNNLEMSRNLVRHLDPRFKNRIRTRILFWHLKIVEKKVGMGLQSAGLGAIVDAYRRLFYPKCSRD